MRQQIVRFVRQLLSGAGFAVIAQDRDRLLDAIRFYKQRRDKGYSLTDCFSMNVMCERRLAEVLTNDHHFVQEGFVVLIPLSGPVESWEVNIMMIIGSCRGANSAARRDDQY